MCNRKDDTLQIHRHTQTHICVPTATPTLCYILVSIFREGKCKKEKKNGAYSKNCLFQLFAVYVRPTSLLVSGYCTVLKKK